MRQLTGQDAMFLYLDQPHASTHGLLVYLYDQSTAPGGIVRFKDILRHVEANLHLAPFFRKKLLRVPLELDFPYLVDDEDFDLNYHVRHIALPKPGDWRQFCIQASRIVARPLDLARPLWRSEEHTSELQSRRDLVCRLLLEKKKEKRWCTAIRSKQTTTRRL